MRSKGRRLTQMTPMGRTTDAIVATLLNLRVQLKGQSQQGACLAKVEPRPRGMRVAGVAMADDAKKIRFHMSFREKLLLAGLTFASRKELLIEFCVIKA